APATLPSPPTAAPDPAEVAAENAPPPAVALIDLNTATLAELNGLKGGGAIGRAIIGHRPYASVDQLLSKRVLNRATYQRIKDQVTVR
ncbi:ComEA family DNA-binding protein, partial [Methylorubrum suomiense]